MVTEHFTIVQVKLANELQKPLFLHCRDAAERFAAVLQEQELGVPAVAHCFTGSREELVQYIEMGLHIGITGWVSIRPQLRPSSRWLCSTTHSTLLCNLRIHHPHYMCCQAWEA